MYIYMYVYIYLYRTDCIRTTNLRNMICLLYLHALYFSNIYFTELIYLAGGCSGNSPYAKNIPVVFRMYLLL